MFDTLKAKIILAIICAVVVGLSTWRIVSWRNDAHKVPGLEKELEDAKKVPAQIIEKCKESKQPAIEANNYDYTNLNNSLNLCLNQLRKLPTKCIPVYSSRPSNGVDTASEQPTSGITEGAIEANNISCQADRDALNAAKVWAKGYQVYKEQLNND